MHISGAVSVTQVNTTVSPGHTLSADDVSVTVVILDTPVNALGNTCKTTKTMTC